MSSRFLLFACIAPLLASGCATITGDATQTIEITAVDANDRPLRGMTCRLDNGHGEQVVTTPARTVEVRRSANDLEIECTLGGQVARGTVVSRGDNKMEHSFIPGGSLLAVIDHVSGYMYAYPTPLVLRAGAHLRFEFSSAARAELVAALTNSAPAPKAAPTIQVTTVTTAPAAAVSAAPIAPSVKAATSKPGATARKQPPVPPATVAAPPSGALDALDARDLRLRRGAAGTAP